MIELYDIDEETLDKLIDSGDELPEKHVSFDYVDSDDDSNKD